MLYTAGEMRSDVSTLKNALAGSSKVKDAGALCLVGSPAELDIPGHLSQAESFACAPDYMFSNVQPCFKDP